MLIPDVVSCEYLLNSARAHGVLLQAERRAAGTPRARLTHCDINTTLWRCQIWSLYLFCSSRRCAECLKML